MPIRETRCLACSFEAEHYYHRADMPPQACDECGGATQFLISAFNAPWTGDLSRFIDPNCSMHNQHKEGHFAYRVKSSRRVDGAPERVIVRTRQDQKEYIKAEGLSDPFEANPHDTVTADGTPNTSRQKGAWV